MPQTPQQIADVITRSRARLLRMHHEAHVGHLGGNLSVLDLLLCLYHRVLGEHDQVVLSKGHAAGALYVTLWSRGLLSDDELTQFHKDGTRLSAHPPASGLPEVLFTTGSLGHGLGLGCGLALAKRFTAAPGHIFVITSDGEWNEGSSWEGLIFARHQKLNNLTVIVDQNGLQGFGSTAQVADLSPLREKFVAFGVNTTEIDGHDPSAIVPALTVGDPTPIGPRAIIASTRKGHGISFMQDKMEWHYLPLNDQQYQQALAEEAHRASSKEGRP